MTGQSDFYRSVDVQRWEFTIGAQGSIRANYIGDTLATGCSRRLTGASALPAETSEEPALRLSQHSALLVSVAEEAAKRVLCLFQDAAMLAANAQQPLHLIAKWGWDLVCQEIAHHLDNHFRNAFRRLEVL